MRRAWTLGVFRRFPTDPDECLQSPRFTVEQRRTHAPSAEGVPSREPFPFMFHLPARPPARRTRQPARRGIPTRGARAVVGSEARFERLATRRDRRRDSGATWRDRQRDSGARPARLTSRARVHLGRCHGWSERERRPPSARLPSPRQHHRETPRESQRAAHRAFTSAAAWTRRTNAPHMEGFPSWESIPPILQPALSTTHRTAHHCTGKEWHSAKACVHGTGAVCELIGKRAAGQPRAHAGGRMERAR
jgi:hypothetical protein